MSTKDNKKVEISNDFYTLLGVVTEDDIKKIDTRIKSCLIENKEDENDEVYIKVWFNYKMNYSDDIKTDGRQEFSNKNKNKLLNLIQDFFNKKQDGWVIL